MNKTAKKTLSILSAGALLTGAMAMTTILAKDKDEAAYNLTVNAFKLAAQTQSADGEVMIPLRAVFENLGYRVEWDNTNRAVILSRGDKKINIAIGKEGYTMGEESGKFDVAPYIFEDTTYTSVDIITDALGGSVNIDGEDMSIVVLRSVKVDAIEGSDIIVNDSEIGAILLHTSDETEYIRSEAEAKFEDIKVGMTLNVLYSPAMTMSIPPQTTALIIELEPAASVGAEVETVTLEGTIEGKDEEGNILLKAEDATYCLVLSDNASIHHVKNKMRYTADDLEKGMAVSAKVSRAMTRSIPAQCVAYEIVISE